MEIAFLEVLIDLFDSCSPILTVMLSYKEMINTTNPSTDVFHYHIHTDRRGKIVSITNLKPGTHYFYTIRVFNNTNLITEAVNGEFTTQPEDDDDNDEFSDTSNYNDHADYDIIL